MAQASTTCLVQEETELEMKHRFANTECGIEMRNCKGNGQKSESPENRQLWGPKFHGGRAELTLAELCLVQITPLPMEANGH